MRKVLGVQGIGCLLGPFLSRGSLIVLILCFFLAFLAAAFIFACNLFTAFGVTAENRASLEPLFCVACESLSESDLALQKHQD